MKHSNLFMGLVCLVLAAIPLQGKAQFSGSGSGTENDPYLIFNPIQLNEVRNYLNNSDVWFKLMFDIDLTEWLADNNPSQGWQPIGTESSPFKGHFLGQGHKITGFFINRPSTDCVGFFGYTSGAEIKDFSIYGESVSGNNSTGCLAGWVIASAVTNCHTFLGISGRQYVGGIIGRIHNSTISSCTTTGDVNGIRDVGGFAGQVWNNSSVTDCTVTSDVTSTSGCAAVGFGHASGVTITRLKADGNVTGGSYVGGVFGHSTVLSGNTSVGGATLTDCTIKGNVTGDSIVGGLVGYCKDSFPLNISGCSSVGIVTGSSKYVGGAVGQTTSPTEIRNTSHVGYVSGTSHIGGLVGYSAHYKLLMDDSYAIGDISASNNNVGGLVGSSILGGNTFKYIYSYKGRYDVYYGEGYFDKIIYEIGQVVTWEGSSYVIVTRTMANTNSYDCIDKKTSKYIYYYTYNGDVYSYRYEAYPVSERNITNSYYCGSITGKDYVGGLVGEGKSLTLNNNYAYSSLISGDNGVGGISGYMHGSEGLSVINSCVANVEAVNARQSNVGRIYGSIDENVTIGENGTANENKGLATSKVTLNGLQQDLPDNLQHGTNVGVSTLKLRATYQGIGWDFSKWRILETECFPYKEVQCAPPVFSSTLTSGATVVSGKSANGGTVYITIGDKQYSVETNANTWSIVVDPLQAGDVVKAYAVNDELGQSYIVRQLVQFKGKGTQAEPYEIYTAADLSHINSYSYYKLMNDIDLTEWINTNSPTKGWIPVGLAGGGSMKQLDGDGHRVTGLWVNETCDFVGLIANTSNATICNMNIYTQTGKKVKGGNNTAVVVGKAVGTTFSNVTVYGDAQGQNYVGGLAGYCQNNTYGNCKVYGNITGNNYVGGISSGYGNGSTFESCVSEANVTGNDYVGGLVGTSTGFIKYSHSTGISTGNNYVGGLSGYSSSTITESYAEGEARATNNTACYAGGIVGVNQGNITDCYSNATVQSGVVDGSVANSALQQFGGGIAGYNYGKVERCFASGDLSAVKFGAGVVGYNDGASATTDQCYAICERIDVSNETGIALRVIGGIKNGAPTPTTNNYALKTMVVSVNNVAQQIYDDLLHGISKTHAELMQGSTYSDNGWNMTDVWDIDEGNGYPFLRVSQSTNTPVATALTIEENVEILKGDTHSIQVNILPNTASTNLNWSSSDQTVVTVNDQGVITGIEVGQAEITAATIDGSNLTATCVVTVKPHAVPATDITLDREELTMTIGQVVTLTATVLPENADNRDVNWNSTDATIATVSSDGEVRAIQTGTTQIYATTTDGSNLSAVCNVTVVDAAGNMLVSSDISAGTGSEVDWVVGLNNEAAITAIQADIMLPEGVTIAMEDGDYLIDLTDRKARDHTVSASPLPDGGYRLLIGSATSKPFTGNEGDLFIIHLVVADEILGGDYNLDLTNVIMSATDATVYYTPDVTTKLTVVDYIRGDANGDRTVNVGDYVTVGNYILNLNPQPFIFKAADVDNNNTINVGDMVGIANIILGIQSAPVLMAPAEISSALALEATCNRIDNDRYAVVLDLANEVDLTAMQLDVTLPAGMSVEDAFLSERASANHQIAVAKLENGDYRLLTASNMNSTFSGQEGTVVTMIVKGNSSGMMTLSNIILAEPTMKCHGLEEIMIPMTTTGIDDIYSSVRIYLEGKNVVVESPCDDVMQIILPNGINTMRKVKAGRNVFRNVGQGIIFIKVANKVAKFRL